jgi:hypothetical protein
VTWKPTDICDLLDNQSDFWSRYCSNDKGRVIGTRSHIINGFRLTGSLDAYPDKHAGVDNLRCVLKQLAISLPSLDHVTRGSIIGSCTEGRFSKAAIILGHFKDHLLNKPKSEEGDTLPRLFVFLKDECIYLALDCLTNDTPRDLPEDWNRFAIKNRGGLLISGSITCANMGGVINYLKSVYTNLSSVNDNRAIYPGLDFFGTSEPSTRTTTTQDDRPKNSATSKSIILYGPPGTGKTFATTALAVSLAQGKCIKPETLQKAPDQEIIDQYKQLSQCGRIRFVTFHQSYSYEDFVEGISARTQQSSIEYFQNPGVFKKIAAAALNVWLGSDGLLSPTEDDPRDLATIFEYAHTTILATPAESPTDTEDPNTLADSFILIIDEINRGNVAKIFGELITLIEDSKRARRPSERRSEHQPTGVTLPLSGDTFYVPPNLHIIGTMNTADRSLVGMDMAMRRRFEFIELAPDPKRLTKSFTDCNTKTLNLGSFLEALNHHICIHDSPDHQIGHAYLIGVKDASELLKVMRNKIIPQLRENMIGRESVLQCILSRSGKSPEDSLIDKHGRPEDNNLKDFSKYPGYNSDAQSSS